MREQQGQQQPGLRSTDGPALAVPPHLDRPEHPELEPVVHATSLAPRLANRLQDRPMPALGAAGRLLLRGPASVELPLPPGSAPVPLAGHSGPAPAGRFPLGREREHWNDARRREAPAMVRRCVMVLLLVAGALALDAATASGAIRWPSRRRAPVYVIGDSVMLGAEGAVVAALAPTPVTVDAQESRSLLGSISLLQQHRSEMGDVVVVALGTNDGTDPVEFTRRIDLVMGVLQGVPHVLWINQREFAPGRAGMNVQLVAATSRYPNLRVLDWNALVVANPFAVGPDGIHLTEAGKSAMAGLVASGVRDATAPPPTTAPPPVTAAPATPAPAARPSPTPRTTRAGTSPGGAFPVGPVVLAAAARDAGRRSRADGDATPGRPPARRSRGGRGQLQLGGDVRAS